MKRQRRSISIPVLLLAIGAVVAATLWVWILFLDPYTDGEASADTAEVMTEELPPAETTEETITPSAEPAEETEAPAPAWYGSGRHPSGEAAGEPMEEPAPSSAAESPEKPETEPEDETESIEQPIPTAVPLFVSLRTVDEINSRPRASTATTTEVRAETWEMWGVMNWHKNLTYMNTQLGDISMLEAYKDDGKEKPLLLFLHGLGDDKESIIDALSAFAEAGYHAVGVDAFDQGDRYSRFSSVDTWAAVLITVGDIDPIVEYYQTVENVDADRFVLGGFSMGAVEATAYLESGSYRPAAVLAFCGMCQYDAWQTWQQSNLAYGWMSSWWGTVWSYPENQERTYTGEKYESILSMDISNNLASFRDVPILFCIGTSDQYFNSSNIQYVANLIKGSGNADVKCLVYPFGRHKLTTRMLTDSIQFLRSVTV